jgi:tetratricopeptide (TPR) repeat protein
MFRHVFPQSCVVVRIALAILLVLLCGCQFLGHPEAEIAQPPLQPPAPAVSEADHSCSYAYFLWGRHAELLSRFDAALEFYQKALICDEQAEFVSEKIPMLLLRMGRTDEAMSWLATYMRSHPEHTGMRMLYAKVLLQQKKNAEAMYQYQLISEQHPDDPAILLLLSQMYLLAHQPNKAKPLLEKVLLRDSFSYPGHILMARLCSLEGKTDEVVAHYQSALAKNLSTDLQMELGQLYVQTGRYDEAGALYEKIIERDPQNESVRVALIRVHLLQKKDNLALSELNRLKTYADQPQRVDLTIARLYAKQKRYVKATALLEKILAQENLSGARYFLAMLLAQQEKFDQALLQVQQIERGSPEYPEALVLQVRILQELDKNDEAKSLLEAHLAEGLFRSAEMYLLLAGLHQLEGREDLSKTVLLQGLELFPHDENLLYGYGLLQETSGDHAAALVTMQKIIDLKPDNAAALNFVGYSWAEQKIHLDQALEYIQRAIEINPDKAYIRDSLGWVYYRLGRLEQAMKELEAAVKLAPKDPFILEHLADVYLESGRIREALQNYRKAFKLLGAGEKEKNRILEKIHILERQGRP